MSSLGYSIYQTRPRRRLDDQASTNVGPADVFQRREARTDDGPDVVRNLGAGHEIQDPARADDTIWQHALIRH